MTKTRRRGRETLGLAVFLALCLGVSAIGGAITSTSVGTWYQALQKPFFNPPDWIFAPVWTFLYILMAIAGWRVWRSPPSEMRRTALIVFTAQLGLNLIWSVLFFGLQRIDLALIEIVFLLGAIGINTLLFWRIEPRAGAMFVPYLFWVAYATALNGSLWLMN
jgi:tryptophan-rich sensory protein